MGLGIKVGVGENVLDMLKASEQIEISTNASHTWTKPTITSNPYNSGTNGVAI